MRTETPTTITGARRALLEELMARLPEDPAAEVGLYEAFGPELRRTLVVLARQLGLPPIPADDLDGLAFDACGVMATVARWWDPTKGALPWTYGKDRLRSMLCSWVGPRTRPLPEGDRLGEATTRPGVGCDDGPAIQVLDRLVRDEAHPVARCFRDALDRVVRAVDHELVLLYAQQLAAGDPSPARTVGALVGRSPTAVRQAFCRARRKLVALALADRAFRALLSLPLLAEPTRRAA
jgi:hypothetical protein